MNKSSEIEVIVLEDGLHAKEVNRYGAEKPKKYVFESSPAQYGVRVRQWEDAESRLRIFEIESFDFNGRNHRMSQTAMRLNKTIVHKAEILPSSKIKIL